MLKIKGKKKSCDHEVSYLLLHPYIEYKERGLERL